MFFFLAVKKMGMALLSVCLEQLVLYTDWLFGENNGVTFKGDPVWEGKTCYITFKFSVQCLSRRIRWWVYKKQDNVWFNLGHFK